MNTPDTLRCTETWQTDEGKTYRCRGGHERLTASLIAENEVLRERCNRFLTLRTRKSGKASPRVRLAPIPTSTNTTDPQEAPK